MKGKIGSYLLYTILLTVVWVFASGAHAAVSLKGQKVTVYVSASPGGGLDLYGRAFARHAAKYLPGNPVIVTMNMPGGGGIVIANRLATTLPRDGTAIAALNNGLYLSQLLGTANIEYDVSKFNWIGRMADLHLLVVSRADADVKAADDMFTKEFPVSVNGPGSYGFMVLTAIQKILGAKLKIIAGYQSGEENRLAMERGEVDGTASVQWSIDDNRRWLEQQKANLIAQIALKPNTNIARVPLLLDLAKDEEQRKILRMFIAPAEIGRAFAAPPGVPQETVQMLREVFMQTMRDSEFLSESAKQALYLNVMDGQALQSLHEDMGALPSAAIDKARAAVSVSAAR